VVLHKNGIDFRGSIEKLELKKKTKKGGFVKMKIETVACPQWFLFGVSNSAPNKRDASVTDILTPLPSLHLL